MPEEGGVSPRLLVAARRCSQQSAGKGQICRYADMQIFCAKQVEDLAVDG